MLSLSKLDTVLPNTTTICTLAASLNNKTWVGIISCLAVFTLHTMTKNGCLERNYHLSILLINCSSWHLFLDWEVKRYPFVMHLFFEPFSHPKVNDYVDKKRWVGGIKMPYIQGWKNLEVGCWSKTTKLCPRSHWISPVQASSILGQYHNGLQTQYKITYHFCSLWFDLEEII